MQFNNVGATCIEEFLVGHRTKTFYLVTSNQDLTPQERENLITKSEKKKQKKREM